MSIRESLRRVRDWARPSSRLERRVKARKAALGTRTGYRDHPGISLIVLSFNHRANVAAIVERLRRTAADEIIVCEDGSIDGAREEWLRLLTRPNEFVICSNDLHEIRAYNRAIDLARGEVVCLLQDDDIPPEDGRWIETGLTLLARHPSVAILGAHRGYALNIDSDVTRPKARWVYGCRDSSRWSDVQTIPSEDPLLHIPFMFVEGVTVGPVFHRKGVLQQLAGFDLSYGRPGEPGTLAEHAICLEAWLKGWQVALFEAPPFDRHVGGQGTLLFSHAERTRNENENLKRIRETYASHVEAIGRRVNELNVGLPRRCAVDAPVAQDAASMSTT